jgi:hypothetical protein
VTGRFTSGRRLGPALATGPPPSLAAPVAVAEDPPEDPEPGPEPLWLKLPAELAPFFDLGFVHSDFDCPAVVFRAISDRGSVEIAGPPVSFLGLAEVITALCRSVPCIAHGLHEEASQREAS